MNIPRSALAYSVFRNIHQDRQSYSVQLELRHGMDDERAEQVILEAAEEHFLDEVKESDPIQYTVDIDKLTDLWYELWEEEVGEAPITPEKFESFLKSYIKSYFEHEKHSTLKEMLVDEFQLGLSRQKSLGRLSNDLRELSEHLNEQYDGKRSPGEHVKYGLDHR
ncbi:MAG: hypothetical protein ABEK16_04955 [Candidatus Nanohalobium sp.]